MILLILCLLVAKVNLTYDCFMNARHVIGHALSSLHKLDQLVMAYSSQMKVLARKWRGESKEKIIDLMDCTIRVIKVREV
jgi:hypothetical protein